MLKSVVCGKTETFLKNRRHRNMKSYQNEISLTKHTFIFNKILRQFIHHFEWSRCLDLLITLLHYERLFHDKLKKVFHHQQGFLKEQKFPSLKGLCGNNFFQSRKFEKLNVLSNDFLVQIHFFPHSVFIFKEIYTISPSFSFSSAHGG